MVVADADGVGIAERDAHDLGRGPGADARQRREAPGGLLGTRRGLEPVGPRRGTPNDLGAPSLDADRVERVIREPGHRVGGRRHEEVAGTGCRLAEGAQERGIGPECLGAGDLLLEDRWDEGVEQPSGAWEAKAGDDGAGGPG